MQYLNCDFSNLMSVFPVCQSMCFFFSILKIKLGNGCTSGHGICGLARLNKRSLAAVISFMTTGILSASTCAKCFRTSTENVKPPSDQLYMKASLMIGLLLWLAIKQIHHHGQLNK